MFEQMSRPAPDHLTVPEAAERMSVIPNTVRRLIQVGGLPATKVGGRWLIPIEAIERRIAISPPPGRRLTPARAWGLLFLSVGQEAPWLSPDARWRMKAYLAAHPLASLRARLVDRGRPKTFRAHPAMIEPLRADLDLMLTGAAGASELRLGLIGGADHLDAYVDESGLDAVVRRYHLRSSRDANVILRVVPLFGWSWPPARVAPLSAIALDLLDSPEPRARQLGSELVAKISP